MKKGFLFYLDSYPLIKGFISFAFNKTFHIIKLFNSECKNSSTTVLISLSRIGDTIFTLPSIKALKKNSPKLTIICFNHSKIIYELFIDDVNYIVVDAKEIKFGGRIINKKYRSLLKQLNPEKIFDLTGSILSASLIFNSKAKIIIGFNECYFKEIYSTYIVKREKPHLIDMYLEVIRLQYNISDVEINREFPASFNRGDKILIHPFAGWAAKEWNINKYIELSELLLSDYNVSWIFAQSNSNEKLTELLKLKKINYIITGSLIDLVEELKSCSCIVSNDSGPLYLASALGKPTFTIYGPTNPAYSKPYGQNHRAICKQISCSPKTDEQYCHKDAGRLCKYYECMDLLSVNEVYSEVKRFLEKLNILKSS